ncbi:hypothetical protein [Mucilaginibacter sp. BT774]|uniref:hypothetical protein n=1 Tax=Mucilaginibacter sp. BT774 TaxID=3062276 RepID=UPI002674A317|nr:hypothetical protein [Mucilaginibacter sp. BT774]MDO3625496.1 hypothetical protein [Mucilaginibacter sp. BT774]
MKLLTLSFLAIICSCLVCRAQQQIYEPQLLILSPGSVTYAPVLQKEVNTNEAKLKTFAKQKIVQPIPDGTPANITLMQKSSIDFLKKINFVKQISLLSQEYLTYRFYERFPNCLLLLKDTVVEGKLGSFQKVAASAHTAYIVSFPKVDFYKENGQSKCKMKVQLYELQSNSLLIDKEYIGDFNNHGFEFTCEQGTIGCTINNALSQALSDVIREAALTNPTLKRARTLAEERSAYIESSISHQPFDASLIRKVIPANSSKIDLDNLYQCFYNRDNTQFVGFFIKTIEKNPKGLLSDKEDKNVKVITSKDIHDKDYLNQSPQTYAYIVKGVRYQGKWYFEKSEVTYFDAENLERGKLQYLNNLQQWDFFADDSATPSPNFWEGKLFKKIEDKRKDPKWEKYKLMWDTEERENRDYIGMNEMIANSLKNDKEEDNRVFKEKMIKDILLPFYKAQIQSHSNHIIKLEDTSEDFLLIFPKDRHVVLNPIRITNENGITTARYFVLLPNTKELYEWTLIRPTLLNVTHNENPIIYALSAFTIWDYSFKTLDDDAFWNYKVLAKEGGNYKYLTKIK